MLSQVFRTVVKKQIDQPVLTLQVTDGVFCSTIGGVRAALKREQRRVSERVRSRDQVRKSEELEIFHAKRQHGNPRENAGRGARTRRRVKFAQEMQLGIRSS